MAEKLTPSQGAPEAGVKWRYEIQYGPEGEANYAWVYADDIMVGTFKTHHAIEVVDAMNRRAASPSPPPGVGEDELRKRGRALADQLDAVIRRLDGQAYSSTLSALNHFKAALAATPVGVEVVKLNEARISLLARAMTPDTS